MKVFDYNSGFMKSVLRLSHITALNFFWLICCIPIVTAGAATGAQHYAAQKLLQGNTHIFTNFKEGMKLYWKRSTVIWIALALLSCFFFFDYMFLTTAAVPGKTVLITISALAFITLILVTLWIFPVMINFKGNIREILFNAFVFAFMYAPVTLIAVVFYGIAGYLMFRFLLVRGLYFVFGQTLLIYATLALFNKVFQKYQKKNCEN